EPSMPDRGFAYHFNFSWHADSSATVALAALATAGRAPERASDADPRLRDMTIDDWAKLANDSVILRAQPESLVVARGEQVSFDQVAILVGNMQGQLFGRTRSVRIFLPPEIVQVTPTGT